MPESFEEHGNLIDEKVAANGEVGPIAAEAEGEVTVGKHNVTAEVDPKHLSARAHADATTVRVTGEADVTTPAGNASAEGEVEGLSAHADAAVGPDGLELGVGGSVAQADGEVGVDVAGEHFGIGGDVGLKGDLGVKLGSTSEVDLPFISLRAPTPQVALAKEAVEAVVNLATDPAGTVEGVASDVVDAVDDAGKVAEETVKHIGEGDFGGAASDVVDAIGDVLGGSKPEPDDHAVTTSEFGGPKNIRPGAKPMD